jgi:hypothetical protein
MLSKVSLNLAMRDLDRWGLLCAALESILRKDHGIVDRGGRSGEVHEHKKDGEGNKAGAVYTSRWSASPFGKSWEQGCRLAIFGGRFFVGGVSRLFLDGRIR